jgi:Cellulase (glycosyl hydrolase family 5)
MTHSCPTFCLVIAAVATTVAAAGAQPLALHPDNPHYFLFHGKPTLLLTSGEHYGAVLNLDFNYRKYLKTLSDDGLNLTRTFPGAYVEPIEAFNIERNTLAPAPGRFICPWARSKRRGYINGGNRFDLTRWDETFFRRLKDFVAEAGKRNIVVELNLFTPMYEDPQWSYSPMKASNNINGIGKVSKHEVYTLETEPDLLHVQEEMVRKIVSELNGFDNLYYEVCNEPYFGGVTQAWHDHITEVIVGTEKNLPKRHLISWNVANDYAKIPDRKDGPMSQKLQRKPPFEPHPDTSIFNFHYARPAAALDNYHLNKALGLNETGFKGTGDDYYRMQAWEFLLAGGGLYNNLDYSFCVGHEDGTFPVKSPTPGGGSSTLRRQLRHLGEFVRSFEFLRMKPAREVVKGGVPKALSFQVLAEPGRQYAVYLRSGKRVALVIDLPAGKYEGQWLDAVTGRRLPIMSLDHAGGKAKIQSPNIEHDCALQLITPKK